MVQLRAIFKNILVFFCIFLQSYITLTEKEQNGGEKKGKVKYTASFSIRPWYIS